MYSVIIELSVVFATRVLSICWGEFAEIHSRWVLSTPQCFIGYVSVFGRQKLLRELSFWQIHRLKIRDSKFSSQATAEVGSMQVKVRKDSKWYGWYGNLSEFVRSIFKEPWTPNQALVHSLNIFWSSARFEPPGQGLSQRLASDLNDEVKLGWWSSKMRVA